MSVGTQPRVRVAGDVPVDAPQSLPRPGAHRPPILRAVREHWLRLSAVVVTALLVFVCWQVVASGFMVTFDYWMHWVRPDQRFPQFYGPMYYVVMLGQRGPTAIPAMGLAVLLSVRRRLLRPFLLVGLSLLALNFVVGVQKLYFARLMPSDNSAAVFAGGIIFPSGHTANVVLTWGIVAVALLRYGPLRNARAAATVVAVVSLVVGCASIYLDTHWVTDILAGWLNGALVLIVAAAIDRRYPACPACLGKARASALGQPHSRGGDPTAGVGTQLAPGAGVPRVLDRLGDYPASRW